MSDTVTCLDFDYEDLWFIKLIDETNKNPLEKWGGYSQDFEAADTVYSHEEVLESDHEYWGVCGIRDKEHMSRALLIFDLDIYKAPAEFNADDVTLPPDWPIVRSQSGGLHAYTFIHAERGEGSESDFSMSDDLGWDIDFRGSYVSHHVVAPNNIPGVGGKYELVNDTNIPGMSDPADAAERIQYRGAPLVEYDSATGVGDFDFDRDVEPPEDMPRCYHSGLQLRKANPDDHPNTHKVNTLTALCGLAAGYSVDEMEEHFCAEYAPGENADRGRTRYHIQHMAEKMDRGSLAPPSVSTLRDWGILDENETCDCNIDYHGQNGKARQLILNTPLDATDETEARGVTADGGSIAVTGTPGTPPADEYPAWDAIRSEYNTQDIPNGVARSHAAGRLLGEQAFMTDTDENVYTYHEASGVYEAGGERDIKQILVRKLGPCYSRHEYREILDQIRGRTYADSEEFNAGDYEDDYLCVGNGVINLDTFEFHNHSPEFMFTRGIPVDRDPDAECPRIHEFLDDITRREEDKLTMLEMVGNCLLPHYDHESFMIMFGGGANGKTTFSELLVHFLHKENVRGIELKDFTENRFKISSLQGKMANVAADISGAKIRDMSSIKKLTGGDFTNAEEKGKDDFDFYNHAKLIFGANEPPVFGEVTDAIKRRLLPIHLPYKFKADPDPNDEFEKQKTARSDFLEQLTTDGELSGLLNEALDGIKRLRENDDFSLPETAEERLAFYNNFADPIYQFATTALTDERGAQLPKSVIYNAFTTFCHEHDHHTAARNVFWEQLRQTTVTVDEGQTRTLTDDSSVTRVLKNTSFTEAGLQYANPASLDEYDLIPEGGINSSRRTIIGVLVAHNALSYDKLINKASESMPENVAENRVDTMLKKGEGVYRRASDDKIALESN